MAKARTAYACTECGGQSSKWQGQCPHCGVWNTLVETIAATPASRFQALAGAPSAVRALASVQTQDNPRAADGDRGIRPRAGRRTGRRRRDSARRRSRNRQVDAAAAGDGLARRFRQSRPHLVRDRRGIGRADSAARAATRVWSTPLSSFWPRCSSRPSSARSARSGRTWSSSIRSRPSTPKRWSRRREASPRCASARRS